MERQSTDTGYVDKSIFAAIEGATVLAQKYVTNGNPEGDAVTPEVRQHFADAVTALISMLDKGGVGEVTTDKPHDVARKALLALDPNDIEYRGNGDPEDRFVIGRKPIASILRDAQRQVYGAIANVVPAAHS